MSYYSKPIIVTFLGVPGSGKSYFSRQAAERMYATRFNSDAMRLSIFGSRENAKRVYDSGNRRVLNSYVFGAMDYAAGQVLAGGTDVFYDANSNARSDRRNAERLAASHNAVPVLVWIRTPRHIAVQRGQDRDEAPDSPKKTEAEMHDVIDRMTANIQEPDETENVIILDGMLSFEEQFADFETQVRGIIQSNE